MLVTVFSLVCRGVLAATGQRLCCGQIPAWTAYVGQSWDTHDVAPANLYNIIWSAQQLLVYVGDDE